MTPELERACELVFQEHKISGESLKWDKKTFDGRISIGLTEAARATLVNKNIILLPGKSKKTITLLNPAVVAAASVEEAEEIIQNKKYSPVKKELSPELLPDETQAVFSEAGDSFTQSVPSVDNVTALPVEEIKWYMRPVFSYFLLPLGVAMAGAVITYLLGQIFFN